MHFSHRLFTSLDEAIIVCNGWEKWRKEKKKKKKKEISFDNLFQF